MGEKLQQEFLKENIRALEKLQKELKAQTSDTISDELLRRIFRRIHTIKGTAQTLSLNNLSQLTHEIENLLQTVSSETISQPKNFVLLLEESLSHLLQSCCDDKYSISIEFLNKLKHLIPTVDRKVFQFNLEDKIPKNLLSKLSTQETEKLRASLESGKVFYLIEVFFDFSSFHEDFINFIEVLNEIGEIIAISPGEKPNNSQEIGFQLFYLTKHRSSEFNQVIKTYNAHIDFESSSTDEYSDDLTGLLSNLIADGERKARILDKKVLFEVSNQAGEISRQNLTLINSSLLHLLRNAVDHAIETPEERIAVNKLPAGRIKISIFEDKNHLLLTVEDDGRGIDTKKITARAVKLGIIGDDHKLTADETLKLIFSHGFSTSEVVSEISGRGIGLDAVKDLVEQNGGEIKVQTQINRGTLFEIYLPL